MNSYLLPSVANRHPLLLVFILMFVGCQPRVEPVAPHLLKDSITTGYILKRLKDRAGEIKNLKSFARTTFLSQKLKQTFRQTLIIQNNRSIRVDTYGLFGQAMGVFTYHKGRTVFFNPANGRYYSGPEVESLMDLAVESKRVAKPRPAPKKPEEPTANDRRLAFMANRPVRRAGPDSNRLITDSDDSGGRRRSPSKSKRRGCSRSGPRRSAGSGGRRGASRSGQR